MRLFQPVCFLTGVILSEAFVNNQPRTPFRTDLARFSSPPAEKVEEIIEVVEPVNGAVAKESAEIANATQLIVKEEKDDAEDSAVFDEVANATQVTVEEKELVASEEPVANATKVTEEETQPVTLEEPVANLTQVTEEKTEAKTEVEVDAVVVEEKEVTEKETEAKIEAEIEVSVIEEKEVEVTEKETVAKKEAEEESVVVEEKTAEVMEKEIVAKTESEETAVIEDKEVTEKETVAKTEAEEKPVVIEEKEVTEKETVEKKELDEESVVVEEKELEPAVFVVDIDSKEDALSEEEQIKAQEEMVRESFEVTETGEVAKKGIRSRMKEKIKTLFKFRSADAVSEETIDDLMAKEETIDDLMAQEAELTAQMISESTIDEFCEVTETGLPADELCADDEAKEGFRNRLKGVIKTTINKVRGADSSDLEEEEDDDFLLTGDSLEQGWEERGNSSAIRRNAEVWKFALKCVFRVLKPRSMRKKGATEDEIQEAQIEAATFIRDGLLKLGPTFVKLGQVVSTRTDVLPPTYIEVLKTLQDEVPGFSGEKAKEIVAKELGKPVDEVFTDFSAEPLKAASLGQVHTAMYKGTKVAIKVQRAGLKELFDVDLKNLKKLAELLDKFDPKSDGADRDWVSIYEESERLLYLEIDYLNEADNTERFQKDFKDISYVRIPNVYRELSTPRVLTMEFVESFKLTDIERIEELGLDRKQISKQVADAFLRQIVETAYFHCDPHPGNLCCDDKGNLVYYDFGMMDELKPNVRNGFRTFCKSLFSGGPTVSDLDLAKNAKNLVNGVEEAGVLARGADRLAVEKLARYFMRSFKNKQLGKKSGNIKETVGTDLQTLTENNVFRFPSTFTFIFRSFASVDGIGKKLDPDFDIGVLAQPFIEKFTKSEEPAKSETARGFDIFKKATGLNKKDIETAVTSPKKISYIEETLRSMEDGTLKVRVRSLENEKALERLDLRQSQMENIVLASLCLNVAAFASRNVISAIGGLGSAYFIVQTLLAMANIKKFDKTQAKFVQTKFEGDEE